MFEEVKKMLKEINAFTPVSSKDLEVFRVSFLGKKGKITGLFNTFKDVPDEQKKEFGIALNNLKSAALKRVDLFKNSFSVNNNDLLLDLSRPVSLNKIGSKHPISIVKNKIIDIFNQVGFVLSEGPEVEDDWHNFSALNIPEEHPAKDMQDTFFIQTNPDVVLRTHTSSVQVRYMENNTPPIRILSPGRVYRNEAISARAHCLFHQVEGLYIERNVSFADLKQVLLYFAKEMFGEKTKIRLRPSYFPFTEPSAELDIYWGLKTEADHKITKGTGWLEILGCGMVDPSVLKNCNINPKEYSGYAFGMGVERIAMLKYGVKDLRLFYENDVRFLKQFSSE